MELNINPEEVLKPRMKPKRRRIKLGDIFEIPLPDGTNAYGRLHKDTTLAIYNIRCKDVSELPEEENYESYYNTKRFSVLQRYYFSMQL